MPAWKDRVGAKGGLRGRLPGKTGVRLEWVKGNKRFQFKKIKTSKEDFDNYEEGNWDNFFETAEDLKIREYVNTNEPVYFFNNCLLVYNKGNKHDNTPAYHLFVNPNNLKISGRDKTLFPNLI